MNLEQYSAILSILVLLLGATTILSMLGTFYSSSLREKLFAISYTYLLQSIAILATLATLGGFFVFFHAIISYFFLPIKFPQSSMALDSLTFGSGLIGTFLLIFLFILSFKKITQLIEGSRWWFLQRMGLRMVILVALIHVYSMKWNGWMKWLKQGGTPTTELANPQMAGLGILVMLFVTWVVIVRLYESFFLFKSFGVIPKDISQDQQRKVYGRRFVIWSFLTLIILYFFVLTRWTW